MTIDKSKHELLSWAIRLTQEENYQALTHVFLKILTEMPGISKTTAFEMYSHARNKLGEVESAEYLIRKFPLDISQFESESHDKLLDQVDYSQRVSLHCPNENGTFDKAILSIKENSGPGRIILIEGAIDNELQELLSLYQAIYCNLVFLHDTKERDVLTKLPNRQSFDQRLQEVCNFYRHNKFPENMPMNHSWLAIMDIDHFKRVNDVYGHLYGDEVLLIFSQLMEKHFRYNDFLFRFGGEEFVVLLNHTDFAGAEMVFNRFREEVANNKFPTVGKITVSIGVTQIDNHSIPTSLLDRADRSLYYAKDHGRNQVIFFEQTEELTGNDETDDIELF